MVIGAMAVGLTGCKTAKMRDADEAYDRGEYFGAEKIYRKLYNKYTKKEERWIRGEVAYKLGLCYKRLNQSSRAAAAFQNAIRYEYPDSTQIPCPSTAHAGQLEGGTCQLSAVFGTGARQLGSEAGHQSVPNGTTLEATGLALYCEKR